MLFINREIFLQYAFINKSWLTDTGLSVSQINNILDKIENNPFTPNISFDYCTNEEKLNLILEAIKDSKHLNLFSKELIEKYENIASTLEQYKDNPYHLKNYNIDMLDSTFYFLYKTLKILLLRFRVAYTEKNNNIILNKNLSGNFSEDLKYLYSRLDLNINKNIL